jgi:hypothetical protein
VFFQARGDTQPASLRGNASVKLNGGTFYAPSAQLKSSGNATLDSTIIVATLTLSGNTGAFELADGATSAYVASTSNQILDGVLSVAVEDDTGAGIDPSELNRINDAINYLNTALGSFGVNLSWAAPGTTADVHIHFASSTPEGDASAGVLGFTTSSNDVYLVTTGWNFYTGSDATGIGAGQYDFQTLATHELAHTVGLGESGDPASVMYEYLSPGTVRRSFTDANLTAINSDADRFMKVDPNAPGGPAAAAGQTTPAVELDSGAGMALLPGRLPQTSSPLDPMAANQLAFPVAIAPGSVLVSAAGQMLADQRDSLLLGSSDNNVLIGGAGNDLILGGQDRDVLVGGFGHCQAESGGDGEVTMAGARDLNAHAEALGQVVAERSAAGSPARLDDFGEVEATAGLSEQAQVDVWAITSTSPAWFLPDAPAQQTASTLQ